MSAGTGARRVVACGSAAFIFATAAFAAPAQPSHARDSGGSPSCSADRAGDGIKRVLGLEPTTRAAGGRCAAAGPADRTRYDGSEFHVRLHRITHSAMAVASAVSGDYQRALLQAAIAITPPPPAGPGPDPSFGEGGWATVESSLGSSQGNAGVVLPSGAVAVGGLVTTSDDQRLLVTMLTSDGTPDDTFGTAGTYTADPNDFGGMDTSANGIATQPDGRIVVAGGIGDPSVGPMSDILVVRLTADGKLDPSFGSGSGHVTVGLGDDVDGYALAVAVQADGRIVVAGSGQDSTSGDQPTVLARLMSDGTADETFGEAGIVLTEWGKPGYDGPTFQSVVTLDDGNVLAGGRDDLIGGKGKYPSQGLTAIARYDQSGALDGTFGQSGRVSLSKDVMEDWFSCTVRVSDTGRIVAPGQGQGVVVIALTDAGALDATFGSGGFAVTKGDFGGATLCGTQVDSAGRILVAGNTQMLRLTPSGQPDGTFAPNGVMNLTGPSGLSVQYLADSAPSGRAVLVGTATSGDAQSLAVARYITAGSAP